MRFRVEVPDIAKVIKEAEGEAAAALTAGMRDATTGLKEDLRADVTKARLGQRLANTWRGQTFPKTGNSLTPAAYVYTNAPKLVDAYDRGVQIRAKGGKYLAIPTPAAGVRRTSTRKGAQALTPAVWERETGIKLRFVPTRSGGMLIADGAYRRQDRSYRNRKNFRPIKEPKLPGEKSYIVYFILVREAKVGKRLDVDGVAKRWADRVPELVRSHIEFGKD